MHFKYILIEDCAHWLCFLISYLSMEQFICQNMEQEIKTVNL